MLHSSSRGVALDETAVSLFSEVARVISNEIDLLEVSSRCRVNPTTLRKILQERPVSPPTERKIRAGLGLTPPPGAVFSRPSRVDRLCELYRLYQEKGTLAAVGRTVGLSRERVRQLLVRGTQIGLFEYSALPPSGPSRRRSSRITKIF
ncbi:MAG: sigma factor-like helix-turn-helix DNA-binding protein (plasmid) [Candidatus Manganitrophus sp.]|nr:MAG: sigma factor-like helix-turn-helix DNA-binding protein [Candidatus Manganitrophus sp.]